MNTKRVVIIVREDLIPIIEEEAKKNHRLFGPQCSYIIEQEALRLNEDREVK